MSCGFHSEKSRGKTNDLQQVAMAANKHLMLAGGCLWVVVFFTLGSQTKLQVNPIVKKKHWKNGGGGEVDGSTFTRAPPFDRVSTCFRFPAKKIKKKSREERKPGCFQDWT